MSENSKTSEAISPEVVPVDYAQELKALLEKNLALTEDIHRMTNRINRYITFQKFMSFIYFLIIVIPIILSIIYLPPLLKSVIGQYGELLGGSSQPFNLKALILKQQ